MPQGFWPEAVRRAIESSGRNVFAFEKDAGLPVDSIRSVVRNDEKRVIPRLKRVEEICAALGWELYIGPPRDLPPADRVTNADHEPVVPVKRSPVQFLDIDLPHEGFAKCGVTGHKGWQPDFEHYPAPVGYEDNDSFYVTALGKSMEPEGIKSGAVVLVSPNAEIKAGDRVWFKSFRGEPSIKRVEQIGTRNGSETIVFRGWITDGPSQRSFNDTVFRNTLPAIGKVVAVYDGVPGEGEVYTVPDPEMDEVEALPNPKHQISEDLNADYSLIKMDDGILAAAANQIYEDDSIPTALAFPNYWLNHMGIAVDKASLIHTSDDAMGPTYAKGTIALIDHKKTKIKDGHVYVYYMKRGMEMTRLEYLSDTQLLVKFDNPSYKSILLQGEELDQIQIIGEVVWSCRIEEMR